MKTTRRAALLQTAGGLAALVKQVEPARAADNPSEAAWRVVETATGKNLRWRDLPARLAAANALFVGEQHDDPQTHKAEAALLEAVHRRIGNRLTLTLEMLERDGQPALNDYLAGKTDEAAFAKAVKLWPNYATDYRPLVEYARTKRIPVLAANAPQRIVRLVGREGLSALEKLPATDRALVAEYVTAPPDAYAKRFADVMMQSGHGGGPDGKPMDAATIQRFYEAQAVRDDTMAETVARALADGRVVFHVNGSFHSDAGMGTAARVLWRRPLQTRLVIIKIVPVRGDVAKAKTDSYRTEADFLIVVPDQRPAEKGSETG